MQYPQIWLHCNFPVVPNLEFHFLEISILVFFYTHCVCLHTMLSEILNSLFNQLLKKLIQNYFLIHLSFTIDFWYLSSQKYPFIVYFWTVCSYLSMYSCIDPQEFDNCILKMFNIQMLTLKILLFKNFLNKFPHIIILPS